MTSVVYQGLQSCLEPPLIESIVLTTKLPSKQELECNSSNGESVNKNNGRGFFNVLENMTSKHVENEQEVYVHPMVKRSASALSTMSLEMCTESLGTETGSDVSESSDEFNWEERERFGGLRRSKSMNFDRKMINHRKSGGNFPPPLTSISGLDGTVKVSPHRVGGRLVIKAVSVSSCGTKFEAQRINGTFSLSLSRDYHENVKTRRAKMKIGGGEEGCFYGCVEEDGVRRWEMGGNKKKFGNKTKIQSVKRKSHLFNSVDSFEESTEFGLTKCKDGGNGNKGIGNWSLFRVVIS
ncbi:hypothetical protein QVD17_22169 [Tagetes erecta]|uniref:FAF domain-containing protein n=1 Tax=Tagetes erecta TaxID=13708 RepID=A0AAD8NLL4_TARER|nr:hypothetical protein QVD17_22169 [Tagetes erecta]